MKSLIVFLLLSLCHNTSFAGVDGWRMNQFTGKPDYYQTGIDSTTIEAIAVSTTALAAQTSALDISTQALASRATALESSTSTIEGRVDGLEISTATLDATLSAEILVRQALSTNVAVDTTTLNNEKVPYTGATGDVNLGTYKITAASASVTELNLNGVARTTWPGGASLNDYNEWTSSNSFSSILISSGSHGLGDDLLAAGAGSRMFFYPKKSAFRAGQVTAAAWNDANIGNQSIGLGVNCTASAQYTNCIGNDNSATYYQASAFGGSGNKVSGQSAFAGGGEGGTISGNFSAIIGSYHSSVTGGSAAIVSGSNNIASADYAIGLGGNNLTISGIAGGAGGQWVQNAADYSFVWGNYVGLSAAADGSMLFGYDTSSVKTYTESGKFYIHGLDLRVSSSTTAAVQYGLTKEGVGTVHSLTASDTVASSTLSVTGAASFSSTVSTTSLNYAGLNYLLTIKAGALIDQATLRVSSTCASIPSGTAQCRATCPAGYYTNTPPGHFCGSGGAPYGKDIDNVGGSGYDTGVIYYNSSCGAAYVYAYCGRIK